MSTRPRALAFLILLSQTAVAVADDAADLGAKIARQGTTKGVVPCMTCHAPDGGGMAAAGYPRIAGLDADYLARQLQAFRSGTRNNPVMMPMAKGLGDDELAAVSAYYAQLPVPASAPATQPPAGDAQRRAEDLVRWGDWSGRGLPACSQCHGPDGNGVGSAFPGIAGQGAGYIEAQLAAWRSGARANDPMGLMKSVAERLHDDEVEPLAAYYAAQPAGVAISARNTAVHGQAPAESGNPSVDPTKVPQYGAPLPGRAPEHGDYFRPPARSEIPDGPFGDAIARGQAIFIATNQHPVSAPYVGNDQACGNCHIDAGRLAGSAPLWAAWVSYPAYRSKNKRVNTFIERVQGCFNYSMNAQASSAGGPPTASSDTMVSLVAYSYWLAKGAPTGDDKMPGRGFSRLQETADGFDPDRGAPLYKEKCALCHGKDGAGVAADGTTIFPPLWGAGAYNWGAGMHKIDTAAAFIRHNMPLGLAGALGDQEAWDLAAFVNSHERPQDPRYDGDLAATVEAFHGGRFDYYGKRPGVDGTLLGERPATR